VPPAPVPQPGRVTFADALQTYTDYIRYHCSLRACPLILQSFSAFCQCTHIDPIERTDLIDWVTYCLKRGHNGKTVYNKLVRSQLLKRHSKPRSPRTSVFQYFLLMSPCSSRRRSSRA
jgi:hypothetical protein